MINFKFLIQRNILFTSTRLRWKILAFFGILFFIDFFTLLSENYSTFYKSVLGITQKAFIQNIYFLPYLWFFVLYGILILFHDDITYDLHSISSNLIIKLHRPYIFLIGKLITEMLFILIFHICLVIEKLFWIFYFHNEVNLPSTYQVIHFGILNLFASLFLCLMFHFFILLFRNTILSFILCLVIVAIGLPFQSHLFPIQFMMLSRTTLLLGCVYCFISSVILFCLNILLFHNIDLLETREQHEK